MKIRVRYFVWFLTTVTFQDDFVIPAEVSMGLVGLYGLYFLAISWDLSNRKRKKRSLFHHQGSQILFSKKSHVIQFLPFVCRIPWKSRQKWSIWCLPIAIWILYETTEFDKIQVIILFKWALIFLSGVNFYRIYFIGCKFLQNIFYRALILTKFFWWGVKYYKIF